MEIVIFVKRQAQVCIMLAVSPTTVAIINLIVQNAIKKRSV